MEKLGENFRTTKISLILFFILYFTCIHDADDELLVIWYDISIIGNLVWQVSKSIFQLIKWYRFSYEYIVFNFHSQTQVGFVGSSEPGFEYLNKQDRY